MSFEPSAVYCNWLRFQSLDKGNQHYISADQNGWPGLEILAFKKHLMSLEQISLAQLRWWCTSSLVLGFNERTVPRYENYLAFSYLLSMEMFGGNACVWGGLLFLLAIIILMAKLSRSMIDMMVWLLLLNLLICKSCLFVLYIVFSWRQMFSSDIADDERRKDGCKDVPGWVQSEVWWILSHHPYQMYRLDLDLLKEQQYTHSRNITSRNIILMRWNLQVQI